MIPDMGEAGDRSPIQTPYTPLVSENEAGLAQAKVEAVGAQLIRQATEPRKVVTAIHSETLRRLVVAAKEVLDATKYQRWNRERQRLQEAVDDVRRELRGE